MTEKSITKMIEDAAKETWQSGGRAEVALMTPAMERALSDEWKAVDRMVDYPLSDGERMITELMTPFGGVKILTSVFCPPDTVYICTKEQARQMAQGTAELYPNLTITNPGSVHESD